MAVINAPIQFRSWYLVRDRVAAIVKDELFHQAAITYEDWKDCDVYTERFSPITLDEIVDTSVITVSIDSITPRNETAIDSDIETVISIAITTAMRATDQAGSDVLSMDRSQIIAGIIHGIFAHPEYIRLKFAPPFIMRSKVTDIKFGTPNRQESAGITMSLVTLTVLHSQDEPESTGVPFGSSVTGVLVNQTDKGYKYEI